MLPPPPHLPPQCLSLLSDEDEVSGGTLSLSNHSTLEVGIKEAALLSDITYNESTS